MKVAKRVLARLQKVYAVSPIQLGGRLHLLAATEERGKCLLFSPPDWQPSAVWDGPGGTMNLVPLPDRPGQFLAIQEFFPIFQSRTAGIVHAAYDNSARKWTVQRVLDLPFVHRIEVIRSPDATCLVAATLCAGKAFQDDWSQPGHVCAGILPENPGGPWMLKNLLPGLAKNHGLHVAAMGNHQYVLAAGREGVFSLQVPEHHEMEWETRQLIDHETSDLYAFDLDGDGGPEIVTIEPFHGDTLAVFGKRNDRWTKIYETGIHFGHALWAGQLGGQTGILVGNRGGGKELLWLRITSTHPFQTERVVLDRNVGPAQITVVRGKTQTFILSANHGADEVSIYSIE
jgi:hypothetical protein